MQELSQFRVPEGSSSALPQSLLAASALRLPHSFFDSKMSCGDFLVPTSSSHGFCAFTEEPEPRNGGCGVPLWGADPQRLLSQSSVLSVSQSMRWMKGGIIVERHAHASSTRVLSSGLQSAEHHEWNGRLESPFQKYGSLADGYSSAPAFSEATEVPSKGLNAASLVFSSSLSDAQHKRCKPPEQQMQSVQLFHKLELIQGTTATTKRQPSRDNSSNSRNFLDGISFRRQAGANTVQEPPLHEITNPLEFEAPNEVSNMTMRPTAASERALLSRQQEDPVDGHVMTEKAHNGDHLSRLPAASEAVPTVPRGSETSQLVRNGTGAVDLDVPKRAGRRKNVNTALARRSSAEPAVDLSSVRRVKGPLSRTQSLEPGISTRKASRVAARPRSKQGIGSTEERNSMLFTASSAASQLSTSDEARNSGSVQSVLQSDWTSSAGRRRSRRSPCESVKSQGAIPKSYDTMPPQVRRNMSTTEAYFGRVPAAFTDLQRMFGFHGQESQRSPSKSKDAAPGNNKNAESSQFPSLQHRIPKEPVESPGQDNRRGKTADALTNRGSCTTKESSKKRKGESRKSEKQRNGNKCKGGRESPLDYTEAGVAIRAVAAAQASAAAAAAARAENAGPVPAWRIEQLEAAAKDQKARPSPSSTLRKSLSFPITVLAKVKAKLTRSKTST